MYDLYHTAEKESAAAFNLIKSLIDLNVKSAHFNDLIGRGQVTRVSADLIMVEIHFNAVRECQCGLNSLDVTSDLSRLLREHYHLKSYNASGWTVLGQIQLTPPVSSNEEQVHLAGENPAQESFVWRVLQSSTRNKGYIYGFPADWIGKHVEVKLAD